LQLARRKLLLGLDLLAAFPPVGVVVLLEGILRAWLSLAELRLLFIRLAG
jgi:hypothetical protein